jgi:hypothetical protein
LPRFGFLDSVRFSVLKKIFGSVRLGSVNNRFFYSSVRTKTKSKFNNSGKKLIELQITKFIIDYELYYLIICMNLIKIIVKIMKKYQIN